MKNLLERLKPEYKAALELEAATYPNTIRHLKEALTKNFAVTNLLYGDVVNLTSAVRGGCGKYIDYPWDFFEEVEG